jgi:hypothetical protein
MALAPIEQTRLNAQSTSTLVFSTTGICEASRNEHPAPMSAKAQIRVVTISRSRVEPLRWSSR